MELASTSGGDKIAGDSDATGIWQYVKAAFGADGTQTIVTASVGLPVDILAGTAEIGNVKNSGTFATQATLQAGTAEIGKLAAGTAVIGEVTIGAATGAAGDLAKAEDAAHASGDIGVMSLAVRNDTLAALAGTDGDYAPFQVNATGALYIQEGAALDVSAATLTVNAHAVTNAGTFVVQEDGAALTALQIIDNIVHVDDAAFTLGTHSGVMMMGFAGTQSVDANDAGAIAMETNGSIHIHDGGNSITVDGTVTANPASGTIDTVTNLAQMNGAAITMGNGASGTGVQRVTIASDTTGVLSVDDNGGSLTVDNGGTFVTQIDGAALTALQLIDDPVFADNAAFTLSTSKVMVQGGVFQTGTPGTLADNDAGAILLNSTAGQMVELMASSAAIGKLSANSGVDIGDVDILSIAAGDNNIGNVDIVTLPASTNTLEVVGDVAHDAAAAGNPLLGAARAAATVEGLTQVAGADSTYLTSDLNGCLVARNGTTLEELVSERISNTNGTSTDLTGAFAAGGAGIHAYITSVTVHNAHASTNGYMDLRNAAAGAIVWTLPLPATGGTTHNFDPPLKFAANTAVAYDVSAAITTVYASFNGYFAQG